MLFIASTPDWLHGSCCKVALISFSSAALTARRKSPVSPSGPPRTMNPWAASLSMKTACSDHCSCERIGLVASHASPFVLTTANSVLICPSHALTDQSLPPSPPCVRICATAPASSAKPEFWRRRQSDNAVWDSDRARYEQSVAPLRERRADVWPCFLQIRRSAGCAPC